MTKKKEEAEQAGTSWAQVNGATDPSHNITPSVSVPAGVGVTDNPPVERDMVRDDKGRLTPRQTEEDFAAEMERSHAAAAERESLRPGA